MPLLNAIGVIRIDNPHEYYLKEYGDELSLTNSKVIETNNNDSGVGEASTSSSIERGWNRIQNRIEQFSSVIGKNIPSKFHSRKSSEGSRDNSTSSGFSSAQHSPQGSSFLVPYENFLIVDDEFTQPRESLVSRRVGTSNRCTGVLQVNDEIPFPECSRSEPQINFQVDTQSRTGTSRKQTPSSESSFWNRMRVVTSTVILRQQPFRSFIPSPSGSLLPNTVSPNAATITVLKQSIPRQATTIDELNEQRMQRIRRYVYIAQGALILIVALLWLASNFIDLKAPDHSNLSKHPLNGSEFLGPTLPPLDHGIITKEEITPTSPAHFMEKLGSNLTPVFSPNEMNRRNSTDSLRPTDIDNAINGNRIDEEEEALKPNSLWHIHAPEMHQSVERETAQRGGIS